uniref:TNFR-Cys domain-containing protein n=1 Tax=Loxodonta africana TaxID=9785 RepID=G3SLA2_LOXAF
WNPGVTMLMAVLLSPFQAMLPTYASEPGNGTKCQPEQYYDNRAQRYCSMCPPGHFVQNFCTKTSDTVCAPCEDNTYTQLCNRVSECLSCNSRCSSNQVEVQACTREQNRICTCKQGWYCVLGRPEGCRVCAPQPKHLPGSGAAKSGTATPKVSCTACAPGTFSDRTSSTDPCRRNRNCSSVTIPGNTSMNTVNMSVGPVLTVALGSAPQDIALPIGKSQRTHFPDPVLSPRILGTSVVSAEMEPCLWVMTQGWARSPPGFFLRLGLIVGVAALGLVVIVLVNCIIVTQRKKKPSCLPGEAKVPHLPADKARSVLGPEEQHLLNTSPSSSSSSLESSAPAADRRVPARNQPQAPGAEKTSGAGEARAS